ncbi:MAG: hypothetical protein HY902_09595 [Deltaproteobacteria bacterium]|nr:hypothetical protein [Deltaproteobacteria bacterium]
MRLHLGIPLFVLVLAAAQAGCGSDAGSTTSGSSDTSAADTSSGSDGTSDTAKDTASGPQVHLRGVAYRFAPGAQERIADATISVVELPGVSTKTDAQGHYDLAVPKGATVTPMIAAQGYHSMTLQTFDNVQSDLEHVHFQTPDDGIFAVLSGVVGVTPDEQHCIIASTTSTKAIQGLTYEQFRAFGAHGVADATASGTPDLPPTMYFDANTVPDKSLKATTADGGVLWTNVPPGVYTISASHPTKKFATFIATCKGGGLVNANPPWGLKEL